MNDLSIFSFDTKEIRVTDQNGDPWFVLRDLLDAMQSSTPVTVAVDSVKQGLGEGFNAVIPLPTAGGTQQVTIVNESAATYLLARSNTERGRELNRFIHIEVLPSIRKTSGYALPPIPVGLPDFTNPTVAARAWADECEAKQIAETKVLELQPKAAFHDRVTQSCDLLTISEAAKILRTGERRLFGFLRNEGLLMRSNLPYQQFMDRGLFRVVETPWTDPNGRERISIKTCLTQKGLAFVQGLQDTLALYQG
jgi:phage antirepressor YoqD-like protein